MTPPPQFAHLMAHWLRGLPGVRFRALWLPPDRLWHIGAEFRTPIEMARMGWTYESPVTMDKPNDVQLPPRTAAEHPDPDHPATAVRRP